MHSKNTIDSMQYAPQMSSPNCVRLAEDDKPQNVRHPKSTQIVCIVDNDVRFVSFVSRIHVRFPLSQVLHLSVSVVKYIEFTSCSETKNEKKEEKNVGKMSRALKLRSKQPSAFPTM